MQALLIAKIKGGNVGEHFQHSAKFHPFHVVEFGHEDKLRHPWMGQSTGVVWGSVFILLHVDAETQFRQSGRILILI